MTLPTDIAPKPLTLKDLRRPSLGEFRAVHGGGDNLLQTAPAIGAANFSKNQQVFLGG